MQILKIIKSKHQNKVIGVSSMKSIEYKLGDIFKNVQGYYFEVVCIELDINYTYHLHEIGYYKTLKNAVLKEFNTNLMLVTDENEKKKILEENCYY